MDSKEPKTLEELLKNYDPAPMEYDPNIDGGEEHLVRDEHLKQKEQLRDVISLLKQKQRGNNKVRR